MYHTLVITALPGAPCRSPTFPGISGSLPPSGVFNGASLEKLWVSWRERLALLLDPSARRAVCARETPPFSWATPTLGPGGLTR